MLVFLLDGLNPQLPLGIVAHLDRVPQVAAMIVGIFARKLLGFIPHQRAGACGGAPVELHKTRLTGRIDQAEGVDTKALHATQAFGNRPIGHGPDHHVRRLWLQ
ncbi:hypothetical protein D3C81_1868570 [compost metagenome]